MSPTINSLLQLAIDYAVAARGWQQMLTVKPDVLVAKDDIELTTMYEFYLLKADECLRKCVGTLIELDQMWRRLDDEAHNDHPPLPPDA